jgi:hypothetical protein
VVASAGTPIAGVQAERNDTNLSYTVGDCPASEVPLTPRRNLRPPALRGGACGRISSPKLRHIAQALSGGLLGTRAPA